MEHIYIGAADEATVKSMLQRQNVSTEKLTAVNDGDKIPFGNKYFQVIDMLMG